MKKVNSRRRGSGLKGKRAENAVEKYLAKVPQPGRRTLQKMRTAIRAAAPASASEIISYGIPAIRYQGVLVWYAAFANHCSFFPTRRVIEEFKSKLKNYRIAKGTIQFPLNKPLPSSLVKKMVRARVAQVEKKKRASD